MRRRVSLSIEEARRIALAAQGFDRDRPSAPSDIRHYRRVLAAINVLQLDFVNVLIPAHFLMIWSRLGAYSRRHFEGFLYDSGEFTEQWAHEASIVPSSDWAALESRRKNFKQWHRSPLDSMRDKAKYLQGIADFVDHNGGATSDEFPYVSRPKRAAGDWSRSMSRWGLEHHFGTGHLAVRRRLKNFQRVYDRADRVIAKHHFSRRLSTHDAHRELLTKASTSLGVATCHDIADYYRMKTAEVMPRLEELVEEGVLMPVEVDGWSSPAFLSAEARLPRRIPGASLLSPFDPMVWCRPRAKRVFGFEYKIEIYVPKSKRKWGYYVLPFRLGDELAARVDLKADRKVSSLLVQYAHLEEGADREETVTALAIELHQLADWLDLDNVQTRKVNAFEKALARALLR